MKEVLIAAWLKRMGEVGLTEVRAPFSGSGDSGGTHGLEFTWADGQLEAFDQLEAQVEYPFVSYRGQTRVTDSWRGLLDQAVEHGLDLCGSNFNNEGCRGHMVFSWTPEAASLKIEIAHGEMPELESDGEWEAWDGEYLEGEPEFFIFDLTEWSRLPDEKLGLRRIHAPD